MRLANPEYLWLFLLLPVLAGYLLLFRRSDLPRFRFSATAGMKSLPRVSPHAAGVYILGGLRLLALLFLVLSLARPQRGLRSEEMTTKATDIMLCLDASRSMLSVDFKPQDRFEVAKQVIGEFIEGREHDRMGLILFAEHAITQCPLTLDKTALLNILDTLEVGVIPPDQTAIGVGLTTSINRLKSSVAKSKIIILVTDGSNNAGVIDPVTAAKTAAAMGIKIYSIGAGSPEGGLMPVDDPLMGRRLVRTQNDLDEDMLLKVAGETEGRYFRAKTPGALKKIFQEIDQLEKTDIKVKEYVDYEELYIWFLLAAFLFLFSELLLSKTALRTMP